MKAIELIGDIDEGHRLRADVPPEVPPGRVRLIVLVPEDDDAGARWDEDVAKEWADAVADAEEDLYTIEDGQPVKAS